MKNAPLFMKEHSPDERSIAPWYGGQIFLAIQIEDVDQPGNFAKCVTIE
jgi:hypothetical protein